MSLNDVLRAIKKSFVPRKSVDFEESGTHFELETLTAIEDVKALEACKDLDGTRVYRRTEKKFFGFCNKIDYYEKRRWVYRDL